MNSLLPRLYGLCFRGLLAISLLSLAACGTTPSSAPTQERSVVPEPDSTAQQALDDQVSSTPLAERSYQLQEAQKYAQIARQDSGQSAVEASLSAAEFYIQANQSENAEQSVLQLDPNQLSLTQRYRYEIVRAYAEYHRQDYLGALTRMRGLLTAAEITSTEVATQRVDALLLTSFIQQKLNQPEFAILALLERESLLNGQARAQTSRYIWQVIDGLSRQQRQQLIASTTSPELRTRLEHSLIGKVSPSTTAPSQFEEWRSPDESAPLPTQASQWSPYSAQRIVVLLPKSSRYERASQAVQDGILYQHSLNNTAYRPTIDFWDVGQNPWQIAQFYAAAQQQGYDLVIGPLGRDYGDTLLQSYGTQLGLPTVLLGGELPLSGKTVRLDLSPENESVWVAQRAEQMGYVNAIILAPSNETGERASSAFTREWLRLGGKISKEVRYSPQQFDHSSELKLLFDLQKSNARHVSLANTLGYRPKFAPYRRQDIDFIYLIGDVKNARIVRPQINFFGGNQLPVFASASIYNGVENVAENMDLNNTLFPTMPWLLLPEQVSPYAGQLNRLFALGSDAYQLAAELKQNQANQARAISGNTGTLVINQRGMVSIEPAWATFKQGKVESDAQLPQVPLELLPSERDDELPAPSNVYNESNWDPRQSSRKSGS